MSEPLAAWQRELFARRSLGVRLGLDVVRLVHARLGRPAGGIPAVHVVGTNGKGSTAAMTAHGLARLGRRVGLYTSPHLHRLGERVRIDGVPLTDEALRHHVDAVLAIEAAGHLPRPLTFFEILTVAAMHAFAAAGVDALVLEAGLGGRLDATRIGDFVVTLVTSIGLDHQAMLGPTIGDIAREKAAVFEHGAPVFSAVQPAEAVVELCAAAARFGVPLTFVPPLGRPPVGLEGEHQRQNAALALAALRQFMPGIGPEILDGVRWPGRLERHAIGGGSILFDVGHNAHGIRALVAHLRQHPAPVGRVILFGCMPDKDGPAMVELLGEVGAPIWLVPPGDHDGWSPTLLASGTPGARAWPSSGDAALLDALRGALAGGAEVVVCGSHYLVGALRGGILGLAGDPIDLGDPMPGRRPATDPTA